MGLVRIAAAAGVVYAVVIAGEADVRTDAMRSATTARSAASAAVDFCKDQREVCAAAAAAAASAGADATLKALAPPVAPLTDVPPAKTRPDTRNAAKDAKRSPHSAPAASGDAGRS